MRQNEASVPLGLLRVLLEAVGGEVTLTPDDLVGGPKGQLVIYQLQDPWAVNYRWESYD
jgi:hypothetical protein